MRAGEEEKPWPFAASVRSDTHKAGEMLGLCNPGKSTATETKILAFHVFSIYSFFLKAPNILEAFMLSNLPSHHAGTLGRHRIERQASHFEVRQFHKNYNSLRSRRGYSES